MRSVVEILCAGTSRGTLGASAVGSKWSKMCSVGFTVLMAVPQWQWKTAAERKCVFVTPLGVRGDDGAGND